MDFVSKIAKEFSVTYRVAENVIKLLGEGATVPFIARYRKEMTNTMNEETVADVKKRLEQLDELEKRKEFVLKSIAEQEKLTPELEKSINNAEVSSKGGWNGGIVGYAHSNWSAGLNGTVNNCSHQMA